MIFASGAGLPRPLPRCRKRQRLPRRGVCDVRLPRRAASAGHGADLGAHAAHGGRDPQGDSTSGMRSRSWEDRHGIITYLKRGRIEVGISE